MGEGNTQAMAQRVNDLAFKILVSPHAAGKIIGRGGENVSSLRKQMGISCHIHGIDNSFPGTGLQVAVLSGSRNSIAVALGFLLEKIVEAEIAFDPNAAHNFTVPVVMSCNAVSAMIGKGGQTVAALKQQAGCGIAAEKDNYLGEQVVRLSGSPERLSNALGLLVPFVERSGDSLQLAMQDYSAAGVVPVKGAPPLFAPVVQSNGWAGPAKGAGVKGVGKGKSHWVPPPPARPHGPPSFKGAPGLAPPSKMQRLSAGPRPPREELQEALVDGVDGLEEALGLEGEPRVQEEEREGPAEVSWPQDEDPNILGSNSSITFMIPPDKVGRVLGKGGTCAALIRQHTGVQLSITNGQVTISGSLSSVQKAHYMVVGRVLAEY